jgi:hypothetical protein
MIMSSRVEQKEVNFLNSRMTLSFSRIVFHKVRRNFMFWTIKGSSWCLLCGKSSTTQFCNPSSPYHEHTCKTEWDKVFSWSMNSAVKAFRTSGSIFIHVLYLYTRWTSFGVRESRTVQITKGFVWSKGSKGSNKSSGVAKWNRRADTTTVHTHTKNPSTGRTW